jgi:hypothetical protein
MKHLARWASVVALATVLSGCKDDPAPPAVDAGAALDVPVVDTPAVDAPAVVDQGTDAGTAPDSGRPVPYAGPDDWCPGRDHCRGTGDNRLYVGAGRALVTPTLVESQFDDRNGDHEWQRNEPFTDVNGNGRFDAIWMAGFGNARVARGVHDDLEVRAIAFRYNDTTVAFAVIDAVGYFINEMDAARADPMLAGLDIDRVIIGATHVHEGVDTVGLWGPSASQTGLNREYQTLTHQRIAQAVRQAVMALRPARMRVVQAAPTDAMGDTRGYVNDTRDPVIYDPTLTVVRFTDAERPDTTLATWINWSAHPEYSGSRNDQLSADYVHWLREVTENGDASRGLTGLGGTTVFVNGALGGQVGPGGTRIPGADGMVIADSGLPKAEAAGRNIARFALERLARDGVDVPASELSLSYRTAPIAAEVENVGYHAYYLTNVFARELLYFDPALPFDETNIPWVRSRVTWLQVGPVGTVTAPGELHPDLWVGTRDARWSWGQPPLTPMQPNSPDLSTAPAPPYLRDLVLMNPGVRYAFVSGLTEDFLGYIVPTYNFLLDPVTPYLNEPAGDHYEETNSIGPGVQRYLYAPMEAIVRWRPQP